MTTVTQLKAPAKPAVSASASVAPEDAKRNKRIVIVALEDYYDEAKRAYRDGRSDAALATELDLAPTFVASVREEFYGKMAEPDGVAALRAELANAVKSVEAINRKLDDLCARNGWRA